MIQIKVADECNRERPCSQMPLVLERMLFFSIVIKGSKLNWDSDANTQYDTSLMQVGRDEVKARMKELESELARAEQTSQLREEVFTSVLNPCYQFFP